MLGWGVPLGLWSCICSNYVLESVGFLGIGFGGFMRIDEKKYKSDFGIDPPDEDKLKAALDKALDIRKFEIDLYWKRAAYFWTLIAAAFAAYFIILNSQNLDNKKFFAFVVACVGFIFTFAWFQVNRGSKQWQENWENHVDALEDNVTGPLYKTILSRPREDGFFERHVTGPSNISVSKTNQIVNLFTLCIWLALAYFSLDVIGLEYPVSIRHVAIASLTLFFCVLIIWKGKTHLGDHAHEANQRRTRIV
ncbi:hypothetical protein ACN22W_13300 [Burkholderia theae]|uniref:RipA family octameric membrane protein n=1 Tax=Burkholderia theae TaxID=3143496 RepID=UPI003AFA833B